MKPKCPKCGDWKKEYWKLVNKSATADELEQFISDCFLNWEK